jgi:hypothetical protein
MQSKISIGVVKFVSQSQWSKKGNNFGTNKNNQLCASFLHTIIHEQFQHKLNYFLFCQIFEKLFITCAIIIKLNSEIFDCRV